MTRGSFTRNACVVTATALLLVLPSTIVLAQDAQAQIDEAEGKAKALFTAGRDAFNAGDYNNALVRWQEAWELSPRPELLYNIGLALDRLRHDQGAVAAFESFLEELPNDPRGPEVRARIAAIREGLARTTDTKQLAPAVVVPTTATANQPAQRRQGPSQAVEPLATAESTPWYGRWYTWAGAGVVAAVAVTLVAVATTSSTDTTRAMPNSGVTVEALRVAP